jgi:hypothetical protein
MAHFAAASHPRYGVDEILPPLGLFQLLLPSCISSLYPRTLPLRSNKTLKPCAKKRCRPNSLEIFYRYAINCRNDSSPNFKNRHITDAIPLLWHHSQPLRGETEPISSTRDIVAPHRTKNVQERFLALL